MGIIELSGLVMSVVKTLGLGKSEGVTKAKDEFSEAVWDWVKPIFLKEDDKLDEVIVNDDEFSQKIAELKIQKYITENAAKEAELRKIVSSNKDLSDKFRGVSINNSKIYSRGSINITGGDVNNNK